MKRTIAISKVVASLGDAMDHISRINNQQHVIPDYAKQEHVNQLRGILAYYHDQITLEARLDTILKSDIS